MSVQFPQCHSYYTCKFIFKGLRAYPEKLQASEDTHRVKATNATSGTAHQSISEAIAKGRMPQNNASVCLWWILLNLLARVYRIFQFNNLQMCHWNWD